MSALVERVELCAFHDPDPDLSWLEQFDINDRDPELRKYARLDRIRRRRWQRDEWWCVGLAAEAVVTVRDDATGYQAYARHTSGGLWGIESDSDPAYFLEVWAEEVAELRAELPVAIMAATPVVVRSTPEWPEAVR